jgi:hypothetical protein
MSNPNSTHFKALERIWKYLVNKVNYKLTFNKQSANNLQINNNYNLYNYNLNNVFHHRVRQTIK